MRKLDSPVLFTIEKNGKQVEIRQEDIDRFWSKVDKSGDDFIRPQCGTPCWIWTGRTMGHGRGLYGRIKVNRTEVMAHRFSYTITNGPLGKLLACHHCDNESCVRPSHLFAGTNSDNQKDSFAKGRHKNPTPGYKGEDHGRAKLTEAAVKEIRSSYVKNGHPNLNDLAAKYNVSNQVIWRVIRRVLWPHVN